VEITEAQANLGDPVWPDIPLKDLIAMAFGPEQTIMSGRSSDQNDQWCIVTLGLPFREIWCLDFEYEAPRGENPSLVCMVAKEVVSGRRVKLWRDQLGPIPPLLSMIRRCSCVRGTG
jgi:hypothetical protein